MNAVVEVVWRCLRIARNDVAYDSFSTPTRASVAATESASSREAVASESVRFFSEAILVFCLAISPSMRVRRLNSRLVSSMFAAMLRRVLSIFSW